MESNKITIHAEQDPVMETIGLMFLMANKDSYKEVWFKDMQDLGINGEHFFEKHAKYIERYVAEFEKFYTPVEDINQFIIEKNAEIDAYFRLLFYALVVEREWVTDFEKISEEAVLERVITLLSNRWNQDEDKVTLYSVRTTDKFITFLDECDYSDSEKWLLLQLYCQPKKIFAKFIALVNANIPAYEKAILAIDTERSQFIESYLDSINEQKLIAYKNLVEGVNEDVAVFPCMIFPETLMLLKGRLYYGVLLDVIPLRDHSPEETRAFLQMRLKALADTSKLQIMQLLKEGEKYNLEIAEHLGITPATTSHHMNVLLATGLIGINKQQGKVYYHLEQDVIKAFILKLEQYLI